MRHSKPSRGGNKRWLIVISTVLMFILSTIIYIQFHQSSLLSNTLSFEEDNVSWSFFQLETESFRLRDALQREVLSPQTADTKELQLRLDIFYSRYGVPKDGKGQKLLAEYQDAKSLSDIEGFFQEFDRYFVENGAEMLTVPTAQHMLNRMEDLREPLRELSLAANLTAESRAEYTANEVRRQITISTGLIIFHCVLALLFSYIVIRQIRQLEGSQSRLSTLAEQFEHSNVQLQERAAALSKALEHADRSYAELSSYMQAIDQHAQVAVVDLEGHIVQVNDKFCEGSGYIREELVDRNPRLLHSGVHPDFFFVELWETLQRGEIWRGEICNRAKDASLYWVDMTIVPLKDTAGKTIRYISVSIDVTEQKEAEQRIGYLASHDTLTGLPNRTLLVDRVRQALVRDRRERSLTAILFIDLDEFKTVNDSFGHEAGDQVLKETAQRLGGVVRAQDTVARQGGDEFIVLLSGIREAQHAAYIGQKLLSALRIPYFIRGNAVSITASMGISLCPDDGVDEDTLLKHSDIAMYHAKASGRDNYQFFAKKLNETTEKKRAMAADLRQAVVRNELLLHFQPIVEMESGEIAGMEALLRWHHPERGAVPPAEFIPLGEETGLIGAIGEWALRATCWQIHHWLAQGIAVPRVAVNLSVKQFRDKSLPDLVARLLQETGVEGRYLGLEITESLLVEDLEGVTDALRRLSAMGIEIAVDDFGTGYSCLTYLKRFPINKLKIDRSFVKDITSDPHDETIVAAIVGLAHGMQMQVVAEGVESLEQLRFLQQVGCDRYQGYYFSKPLCASDIEQRLLAGKAMPAQRVAGVGP